jgi:hypothetical protein
MWIKKNTAYNRRKFANILLTNDDMNCTVKIRVTSRIEAAGMCYVRVVAGY